MILIVSSLLAALVLVAMTFEGFRVLEQQKARQGQNHHLLENLHDPREAAAILMVQIPAYTGNVRLEDKDRIAALMVVQFSCTPEEAEGLFSFGRMAVGQLGDAQDYLPRLLRPIRARLTLVEMKDLMGMLAEVTSLHSRPHPSALELMEKVGTTLRVEAAS